MHIEQKLEILLNKALPKESKLKLKVNTTFFKKGYSVQIIKDGRGLETFYINWQSAIRLIEDQN